MDEYRGVPLAPRLDAWTSGLGVDVGQVALGVPRRHAGDEDAPGPPEDEGAPSRDRRRRAPAVVPARGRPSTDTGPAEGDRPPRRV